MIRGSDGYDYEDLAARIRDEKAPTLRNTALANSEQRGRELWPGYEDAYIRSYRETYDHYADLGYANDSCRGCAHAQANFSAEQARAEATGIMPRIWTGVPDRARAVVAASASLAALVDDHFYRAITAEHAAAGPAGAGRAHPGQAPADPVHAAD